MTTHSKLFILLSIFTAFSFSCIFKAAAGRRRLLMTGPMLPTIPKYFPFPSIPCIPVVYYINWDFNIKDWPSGKTFHAGDILVFNYNTDLHNVVLINETDYQNYLNCVIPDDAKVFNSGHDAIRLQKGANYFICGTMGHCTAGMQIAVVTT